MPEAIREKINRLGPKAGCSSKAKRGLPQKVPRRTGARALFSEVTSSRGGTPTQRPGDIVRQNRDWKREVQKIDKCVMDATLIKAKEINHSNSSVKEKWRGRMRN